MTNHSIDKDVLSNTINNNSSINNNATSTKKSTKTVTATITDDTISMDCQQQEQHPEQQTQQKIVCMDQQQQVHLKVKNELLYLEQEQQTQGAVISNDNIVTNNSNSNTYTNNNNNNNNDFILPKLIYPSDKELEPILIFTAKAVYEQHYGTPLTDTATIAATTDTVLSPTTTTTTTTNKNKINNSYRALIDTFQYSKTQEPTLVRNILLSLAISGNGRTLDLITSTSTSTSSNSDNTISTTTTNSTTPATTPTTGTGTLKHARLIHQILLFNPFSIQIVNNKKNKDKSDMDETDKNDDSSIATATPTPTATEANDDNDDEQTPDYSIVYAYIHLLLAFVTKNTSILLQPTIQTIWKLLATKSTPKNSDISTSLSNITTYDTITYCLHSLLATIVRIVPESTSYISNIVLTSSYVPNKYTPDKYLVQYYKLCWIVVQYIPSLCSNIYKLIINTCIEMDVELIIQDSGIVTLDDETNDNAKNNDNDINTKDDASIKTYTTATTTATATATITTTDANDDTKKTIPTTEGAVTVQQDETTVATSTKGTAQSKQQERIKQLANKLDLIMLLLFQQTEQFVSTGSNNTETNTTIIQLYDIISSIFENVVLVTHKSKFVQFLLLHLCGLQMRLLEQQQQQQTNKKQQKQQKPEETHVTLENTAIDNNLDTTLSLQNNVPDQQDQEDDYDGTVLLYREFAAKLIEIVLDPIRATVIRQTSACYLASFVCRAKYVTIQTICESLEALIRWSEAYIESIDINQNDIYHPMHTITDTKERCAMYALFYTVVQSALYIMCFNGYEIHKYYEEISNEHNHNNKNMENNIDNPLEYIKVGAERWSNICCHWLQPLRYCLESVRSEFLQISKQYKLLDDSTYEKLIVEEEKRIVGIQQLSVVRKHLQRRNSWYTRKVRRSYEINTAIPLIGNEMNTPEQQQQQMRRRKLLRRSNSSMSISTIATSISVGTTLRSVTATGTPSSATKVAVAGTNTGTGRLVSSSGTSVCNASVSTAGLENERQEGGVGGLGQGTNPLDSFFPFDPYLLRLSHDYVDPYYRHWTSHTNDDDDDDMMDDDEYDNNENNSDNESDNNKNDDDESYDEEMVGTEVHAAFDREDASTIADNNSVMPSDDDDDEDSVDIQVEKIDYGNANIDNQSIMEEDDDQSSLASDTDDDHTDDNKNDAIGGSIVRRRGIIKSAHSVDGVVGVAVAGTTNNDDDDDENSEDDDDTVQECIGTSNNQDDDIISFDNVTQQNNFIQLLKRPRAPSMETGSW